MARERRLSDFLYDLRRTGISIDQFMRMMSEQNNSCKICKIPSSALRTRLHVDHCHISGKVRSLLCGNCNHLLGKAKESIAILKAAIEYLELHK